MKDNKNINIGKLNNVIKTSDKLLKTLWFLLIVGVILLITYIFKEWKILEFLGSVLTILSPLFIGIVIAWLLDPLVTWLSKNGLKRTYATILVFLSFISLIILFLVLMIPALVDQVNDFISSAPNILNYISDLGDSIFDKLSNAYEYDFTAVKEQVYMSSSNVLSSITVDLPNTIINFASSLISGGLNIIFGFFIAFYMLFDFNNIRKHLFNLLPKKVHSDAITLTDSLNKTLKNYVQGTFLIMVILFIFQSILLSFTGLSSPMLFGLFCAVTNVILPLSIVLLIFITVVGPSIVNE